MDRENNEAMAGHECEGAGGLSGRGHSLTFGAGRIEIDLAQAAHICRLHQLLNQPFPKNQRPRSPARCPAPRAGELCARMAANSELGFHCGQARLFASRAPIA